MINNFPKSLFFLPLFIFFFAATSSGQTLSTPNFTGGTFAPGASIGVPFHINNAGGCIQPTNQYNLYLSDAAGNFAPGTIIGTTSGAYATFVNGVIPAGTAPGSYKVMVKATAPVLSSGPSTSFTVVAGTAVTASVNGQTINTDPHTFGACNGQPNTVFDFSDASSTNSSVANFFNEGTQSAAGTVTLNQGGTFTAAATNYTILATATDGTTIGTQAYSLINNVINNSFEVSNTTTVCLAPAGGTLSYFVDTNSPNGIQNNYPGVTYHVSWGDGSSNDFSYCDITALSQEVSHTYTTGSCGNTANGIPNSFEVDITPVIPYCNSSVPPLTSYARILRVPINSFTFPPTGCTNAPITFTNTSDPGQDPTATVNNCINPNARYTWFVDGVPVLINVPITTQLTHTFTTNVVHSVTLHLIVNGTTTICSAADVTQNICIQNPPQPAFTIPATLCSSSPLIPTDQSVLDPGCSSASTYLWTVTGPAPVNYAGGTNASSVQPQFLFPVSGTYSVTLTISNSSCSTTTAPQTINVDASPTVSLSPDFATCSTNLTYNFGPAVGQTQTTIAGTAQAQANTYAWTVTGNTNYTFVGGTTAASQYPQIQFTAFATYTISVTVQNSCGTVTKSQKITFENAPVVTLSPSSLNICPGSPVTLTGTITPAAGTTFQWIGSGVFSAPNALVTDYTPTAAEIAAHSTTVKLVVQTGLTIPCNQITQTTTINIYPVNSVTSPPAQTICTGNAVNYNITAVVGGSTYTWTAAVTSGTATGVPATGSGSTINDVITDTDPLHNAVVTYTITPQANSCPGAPFTLTVNVKPDPIVTATPVNTTICSGSSDLINLLSNIAGTTYTWSSTVQSGNVTGNQQQAAVTSNNSISDVLTNTGNTLASVVYTITPFNGNCQGTPVKVTINVQPLPTPANPGPDAELCAATTYTLNGNVPTAGTGKWTVNPSTTVTFNDDTQPNAIASGLVPGTTYVFTWTISVANCQSSSNNLTIKDDVAPIGGTANGGIAVCSGSNGGTINLTGQMGNIISWEQSINNGATWQTLANNSTSQTYLNLTTTTEYRALVQSGICTAVYSTIAIITVNAPAALADAGPDNEVCGVTSYTLQGNSPGAAVGKWTVASGPAGATFADDTQPNTTVSGLIPGSTYNFTWTITPSAPCVATSSTVAIKDDAPPVGGTTAGSAAVCSGSGSGTITLSGQFGNIIRWEQSVDNGVTWQPVNNATVSLQYLNLTVTTEYRAVVQNGVCASVNSSITTITVNPPAIQADAGANNEICASATYALQGNDPGTSAGKWTLTTGQAGVTFADATKFNTTVSGLAPGNTYGFTWTITPSAPCVPTSSSVTIIDDPATVGGNTNGNAVVCGGGNAGSITLSGQVGNIIRWEQSTDNGATWQTIANATTTQQYLNLTTTTQYRAVVQSAICQIQYSTVTTITVNPPTLQADAGSNQNLCGATSTTLAANNPSPFIGTWTQTGGPATTIVSPNSFKTLVNGLIPGSNYTFVWTIQGLPPCANTSSAVQIFTAPDVTPSFTADKNTGCGPFTVAFTNTSNLAPGTTFLWNFGDGSPPSNTVSPSHTFVPRTDGKDTTYHVTLSILNNCFSRPPFTVDITVKPSSPVATILPLKLNGCSPFVITVKNTSPGTNISYVFYLYDGSTLIQQITKTDKSDAVFAQVTTNVAKTYTVYMDATGTCNNTAESAHVPISVSPASVAAQMFIQNNINNGCVPLNVTFINNSFGGLNFYYTIFDKNGNVLNQFTASKANFTYTFNTVGTYYVSLTGSDNCSTNESPRTRLDVYPIPQPQFDADVKSGCDEIPVKFTNLTPDDPTAPASSLTYLWNFGDGTEATGFTPPTHIYAHRTAPFTVTLTATNPATGCSNVMAKQNFIMVNNPPGTEFAVKPDSVISIPYYHFSFVDGTSGAPTSWKWTLGDGATSTKKNVDYTYSDTGLYKVTLTTSNSLGCDSTVSHFVRITGVPGQLFLPNAFEPAGLSTELRTFMAKGSGIKKWHMQIFNNYAQLIWETTLLNEKGQPMSGWDGTIKGKPAPQGVYVWQVSATFINGTEWKGNVMNSSNPQRVGVVHLIR